MAGTRNHYERAFSGWLAASGVQAMAVDERRRPVVETRRLKNFDFLVNGYESVLALDLKGRRHSPWITRDDLYSMMAWRGLLRERVEPAFLFAFYAVGGNPASRLAELPALCYAVPGGVYRFALLWLEDAQRLARPRSAQWGTYGFQWAAFCRAVRPLDQLVPVMPQAVAAGH